MCCCLLELKRSRILQDTWLVYTERRQRGDVDMGKCTLSMHGGDRNVSPFLQKELPNVVWDARKMDFS